MTDWLGKSRETDAARVAVAGFEPFDGRSRNRSWDLVRAFRERGDLDVFKLPVDFGQLRDVVGGILGSGPRAVLLVGEMSTDRVRVEQLALNVADNERPDNAGRIPRGEPLVPAGPLALRSPWDARGLAGRMFQQDIPAEVSYHAGTFACNAALYLALHRSLGDGGRVPVGFLHVPNSRGASGLGVKNLERAVEMGIETLSDLCGDTE